MLAAPQPRVQCRKHMSSRCSYAEPSGIPCAMVLRLIPWFPRPRVVTIAMWPSLRSAGQRKPYNWFSLLEKKNYSSWRGLTRVRKISRRPNQLSKSAAFTWAATKWKSQDRPQNANVHSLCKMSLFSAGAGREIE